jgi:hypothetical protein
MRLAKMVRCRRTVEFVQFAIRLDRFGEDKKEVYVYYFTAVKSD